MLALVDSQSASTGSVAMRVVAAVCMLLCCGGCATERRVINLDATHPELRIAADGVYFGEEKVAPEDIVETLEDAEISKERAIHILLDHDMRDLRAPRALMALLAKCGYTRSVLVTQQHGESINKEVRLGAAGFMIGSRNVVVERIPAELERLGVPKDKLLQIIVDQDVRDDSQAEVALRLLKRSGYRFVTVIRSASQDVFLFYVTESGVTYGQFQPVEPGEVVQCLRRDAAQAGSPIRICGYERDAESETVQQIMRNLEIVLKRSGYANVNRFWMKPGRQQSLEQGSGAPPARGGGIRYKRADE